MIKKLSKQEIEIIASKVRNGIIKTRLESLSRVASHLNNSMNKQKFSFTFSQSDLSKYQNGSFSAFTPKLSQLCVELEIEIPPLDSQTHAQNNDIPLTIIHSIWEAWDGTAEHAEWMSSIIRNLKLPIKQGIQP